MEDIVGMLIPVTYIGLLILERVFPARKLPAVRYWTLKGLVFFVLIMVLSAVTPALTVGALGKHSLLDLSGLGILGGGLLMLLVSEFVGYFLHRAFHNVSFLWRWVHQLHHSAERLDVLGAAFISPNEVILGGVLNTIVVMALGVSPDAAAIAGGVQVFASIFQHANVKTPRFVGYLLQRPEAHSIHHARGVHAYNYGNITLFDILFGTFRNPKEFSAVQGFWDGASSKIGPMLIGRDVSEQAAPSANVDLPGGVTAAG